MKTRDVVVIAILIYLLWPPKGDATVTIGPGTPLPPVPVPGSTSSGDGSSGNDGSGAASDAGSTADPGVYPDGNPVWDESGNVYQPMSDGSRIFLGNVFDGPVCGNDYATGQAWCVEYVVTQGGSGMVTSCPAGMTYVSPNVCAVPSAG